MIEIGKIIEEKLAEEDRKPGWLARQMGRSRSYVERLLEKSTIDIGDLIIISKVLKFNFFTYYYTDIEEHLSQK
jgi:plasmid maintenance system antidote protein VapI